MLADKVKVIYESARFLPYFRLPTRREQELIKFDGTRPRIGEP